MPKSISLAIMLASLLVLSACVTTPVSDRRQINIFSEEQMASLGEQSFADVVQAQALSADESMADLVRKVGRRIVEAAGESPDKWNFVLLDDQDMVNAFALPGGKVAVYTGLLPVAKTEAGLAAVLGHEVAHVLARHGGERLTQVTLAQAGMTAADIALGSSEHRSLILPALGLGAQLGVLLPYSRLHESEADEIGLQYMARAGYDPREAMALWERMGGSSRDSHPPKFLATHPSPGERLARLNNQLDEALQLYAKSDKQASRALIAH